MLWMKTFRRLEDDFYSFEEFDDDEECDCCDCDDDEELYEVTCPECGETVYLDAGNAGRGFYELPELRQFIGVYQSRGIR